MSYHTSRNIVVELPEYVCVVYVCVDGRGTQRVKVKGF